LYNGSVSADNKVGTITIKKPKFVLKLDGQNEVKLDLYFAFTGKWSISGIMNSFIIGKFDLTYEAIGTYNRTNNVPFAYHPEQNCIEIYYGNAMDGFVHNYLLLLDDNNLIVSSYPYFVSSDQWYYASHSDELVGAWENTETGASIEFDGCADSKYAVGVARDSNGVEYRYTRRFGTLYLWLEDGDDVLVAYTIKYDENNDTLSGANVYRKPNTRFGRIELTIVDILGGPIFTAQDKDGTEYKFNFDGTGEVGDKSGSYLLNAVDEDKTTVDITIDGKKITAVVDHNDETLKVID
ncbi:MAG: hypothetical protein K2G38_07230, partial [Clostridia bacterium]|nr:hypothetical protein [Clostridia bacterium]